MSKIWTESYWIWRERKERRLQKKVYHQCARIFIYNGNPIRGTFRKSTFRYLQLEHFQERIHQERYIYLGRYLLFLTVLLGRVGCDLRADCDTILYEAILCRHVYVASPWNVSYVSFRDVKFITLLFRCSALSVRISS